MHPLDLTSLLAVHAHPDDETLSNGGLLAATAAAGLPVGVVTLTRGEQGEVIGPLQAELEGHGQVLARHRTGELAQALSSLGSISHTFLDQIPGQYHGTITDSGMAWLQPAPASAESDSPAEHGAVTVAAGHAEVIPEGGLVSIDLEDLATRLARHIIDVKPQTVVTYEPGGGYGHPDHVRAHRVTVRALEIASTGIEGQSHTVGRLLWTVIAAPHLAAGRNAVRAAGNPYAQPETAIFPTPGDPLASVAQWDHLEMHTVDIRPGLPAVLGALGAHATQVQWVHAYQPALVGIPGGEVTVVGSYALSNGIVAPLLSHEFYVSDPVKQELAG